MEGGIAYLEERYSQLVIGLQRITSLDLGLGLVGAGIVTAKRSRAAWVMNG